LATDERGILGARHRLADAEFLQSPRAGIVLKIHDFAR
jgi:hypothetical protein